jgi:transposase
MDVVHLVVCGLDVHKDSVVASVIEPLGKKVKKETRTFATHTCDLYALRTWLRELRVDAIAMEGTGIYWRPIYAILEEGQPTWKLVVGNAMHIKNVPGRKTDVLDAEWLAQLVRHGLIRPSFVPPPSFRELRDLTRYRKKLVEDRTRQRTRIQKVLQAANIKLDGVATDIFGVSGMAMLRALAEGLATPAQMALLAKGVLRKKIDALQTALDGKLGATHRAMLTLALELLEAMDRTLIKLDAQIDQHVAAHEKQIERLDTLPGVDRVVAIAMLAELGPDMAVFPTAGHCASWAGVCPGNNESAGKHKDGRPRRGNPHLKTMLCQAAQSAAKTKGTHLRHKFYRLKARRGHNKAIMAIAHSLLIAAYAMLSKAEDYRDLGETWHDQRNRTQIAKQLTRRLTQLGFAVALSEAAPDSPIETEAPQ